MLDDKPTADTLLAARLARGWTPTPTEMRDGPQILGHAACVAQWRAVQNK